MTPQEQPDSQELSNCHKAPVTIGGRGDFDDKDRVVTQYYVCSECSQPCDLWRPDSQPPDPSQAELDEALSNHENLCEDQSQACGDCRRLKADLNALLKRFEKTYFNAVNGPDDDTAGTDLLTNSPKANSRTSEAQSGAGEKGRS